MWSIWICIWYWTLSSITRCMQQALERILNDLRVRCEIGIWNWRGPCVIYRNSEENRRNRSGAYQNTKQLIEFKVEHGLKISRRIREMESPDLETSVVGCARSRACFFFIFGWVLREISIVENTKELVAKAGRCGADVVGRSSLTCRSNDDGVAFRRLQTTQRASTVGPDHLHCPLYHYEPKENVIAQKNDPQGMELENGSDLTIAFSSNYGSLRVFSWLECDIHRINHECGLPMKYATEWSTPLGTSSTENPVQPCCVFVEYWGSVEVDFVRTVTCRRPRWPMWLFAFFFNRKRRITSSWWWSTATVVTWPTTCQVSRMRETSKGNQSYFNCFADLT